MTLPGQTAPSAPLQAGDLAAALDWWRGAGVDLHFEEAPHSWLAAPEPVATASPQPAAPRTLEPPPEPELITARSAPLPDTWNQFREWWLVEPALDNGIVDRRVPPRGPAGAVLMVLVPYPESQDGDRLLSGSQGQLLDAMLTALGFDPAEVYVASCLPRHMPLPDWGALKRAGLGEIAAHHIALAQPQRLLLLDPNISSLLGHDPAKSGDPFTQFNHGGAMWPTLTAPGLDILMARPRSKARLWQALLDWTG